MVKKQTHRKQTSHRSVSWYIIVGIWGTHEVLGSRDFSGDYLDFVVQHALVFIETI